VPEGANFCHLCGSSLEGGHPVSISDPLIGRVIANRYRIGSLIGRGGMGVVYKGEHIHMGKHVAIKILSGEFSTQRDLVKRFRREAEAASRLSNFHTVTIFDYGESQGLIYLVMEYLEGKDLQAEIRQKKRIEIPRSLRILMQVCDSLSEAHEKGIIHRDLKPENIYLVDKEGQEEFVKVLDFGLAKIRAEIGSPDETAHGVVLGTPFYMAPEQIKGENQDQRSDIYSLGALLFTMLTGHPPFVASTPVAVMAMHLTNPPPELDESCGGSENLRKSLNGVIQKCMEKESSRRFGSAVELKKGLQNILREMVSEEVEVSIEEGEGGKVPSRLSGSFQNKSVIELKAEFDRYERMLRLRRVAMFLMPPVLLAVVSLLIYCIIEYLPGHYSNAEKEPNDFPEIANKLIPGKEYTGTIGRRISLTESDHDWYKLEVDSKLSEKLFDIVLSGIPDLNIMLQIFKEGEGESLRTAKSGGKGEGEMIRNLNLKPGIYYILVREDLSISGKRPAECISDFYSLSVSMHEKREWESEPNDSFLNANQILSGQKKKGYLDGWGDSDYYFIVCGSPGGLESRVENIKVPTRLCAYDFQWNGLQCSDFSFSPSISLPSGVKVDDYFLVISADSSLILSNSPVDFKNPYFIEARCIPER